jgi:hypothetical protein
MWDMEIPYFPVHKMYFFPEKCDLNSTCILCAKGKYRYDYQTYKYPSIYYTSLLWLWFQMQWQFSGFLQWINNIMVANFGM